MSVLIRFKDIVYVAFLIACLLFFSMIKEAEKYNCQFFMPT